jgi:hypothetical protein
VGPGEVFAHLILTGIEARKTETGDGPYILGINMHPFYSARPRLIERWRFGGELLLFVTGGLYLNFGELVDSSPAGSGSTLPETMSDHRPFPPPRRRGRRVRDH